MQNQHLKTVLWQTNKNCGETLIENCLGGCSNGTCNPKPPPKLKLEKIIYPEKAKQNEPIGIYIEYTNEGDDASSSFVSPSFDPGWEITDYGGDLPLDKIYNPGDLIWNSNNQQFPARDTLIDFKGYWKTGKTKGFWFTIKPKSSGALSFKVRGVLIDGNNNYFRDPRSGQTDQQYWYAYNQNILVTKPAIKIESVSVDSATYKKCGVQNSEWSCSDFTENNPPEIYGGSKIKLETKLSENNFKVDTWNQFSGWKYNQISPNQNTITQEIQLPKDAQAGSLTIKVVDKNSCDAWSCKETTKSIPIKITPNKNPEIRDVKLCYDIPEDDGSCGQIVPSKTKTPGGPKVLEFGPVPKEKPVALYFRLHNLENKGTASSYTTLELDRKTPAAHNKLVNGIQATRQTDSDYPGYLPIIWVFNSSSPGTHTISIKTIDLQDSDSTESVFNQDSRPIKLEISIGELKEGERPGPIQYLPGYAIEIRDSIQSLDQLEGDLANNIIPTLSSEEERNAALQQLAQITVIQSLLKSRQATIASGGNHDYVPDLINRIGSVIGGFVSWVGGALKGIGETLWDFANDPIGSLQRTWDWVSKNPHQAIDLAIIVATVAVIAVAIVASGGVIGAGLITAAPAILALDVATVANIVAKVAISKQPLDAFDLITIGLVGVANAGVIARALKPVLKPTSPLFKIQNDLDANIARLGENTAAKGKIQKEVGRITDKIKGNEKIKQQIGLSSKQDIYEKFLAKRIGADKARIVKQALSDTEMETLIQWERRGMLVDFDFTKVPISKQTSLVRQAYNTLQSSEFDDAVRVFESKGVSAPRNLVWKLKDPDGVAAAYSPDLDELMATLRKPVKNNRLYSSEELYDNFLHELGHKASVSDKITFNGNKFTSLTQGRDEYWDWLARNLKNKNLNVAIEDAWDPFMNTIKNKLLVTNSMVDRQKWLKGWEKQFEDMGITKILNKNTITEADRFLLVNNQGYLVEMKVMYKELGNTEMIKLIDLKVAEISRASQNADFANNFNKITNIFSDGFNSVRWVN